MDFLLYLEEIGVPITWSVIILFICGVLVYWYIIWCFLKSAVKNGVAEALKESDIGKVSAYSLIENAVAQGILDAMKEIENKDVKKEDN